MKKYYAIYAYQSPLHFHSAWYQSFSKKEVIKQIGEQCHRCFLVEVKENKKRNKIIIKSTLSDGLKYPK